jgi:pimeloyl-ACP methyl ester carboxylesterase
MMVSRWDTVDGMALHSRVSAGPAHPDAPPVVLVHGLAVSSRYMVPTARLLARDYQVYAPDLPGFGLSAKPRPALRLEALADVLARWMDVLGLKQAAFLGNSFGCQIIVSFALRHPERITAAVLQGPSVDRYRRTVWQQALGLLLDIRFEHPTQPLVLLRDYLRTGLRRLVQTARYALQDRVEDKLPFVGVPALVVHGERDPIVSQRWAEEVARLLPHGRLVVVPGGSHTMNYSMPLELVRVTHPFLQAHATIKQGA